MFENIKRNTKMAKKDPKKFHDAMSKHWEVMYDPNKPSETMTKTCGDAFNAKPPGKRGVTQNKINGDDY